MKFFIQNYKMLEPYKHRDKTFIYIDDRFYSFGTCYGFSEKMFTKPRRCWMVFSENKILCGDAAFKSIEKIKFPVFEDPTIIQNMTDSIPKHYTERIVLKSRKLNPNVSTSKIIINMCYFTMIDYIVEEFIKAVKTNKYILDKVAVILDTNMNKYVREEIRYIFLTISRIKGFKIQFVDVEEAIADRLSLKECNGKNFTLKNNCLFLHVDVTRTEFVLRLYKAEHSKENNYVVLPLSSDKKNYIVIGKKVLDYILETFKQFGNFESKSPLEKFIIDNEFRKKLNLPMNRMNKLTKCSFSVYTSDSKLVDVIQLNEFDLAMINNTLNIGILNFNTYTIGTQRYILTEIVKRLGRNPLSKYGSITKIVCDYEGFSEPFLPELLKDNVDVNFYNVEFVESRSICRFDQLNLFDRIDRARVEVMVQIINWIKKHINEYKELKYIVSDMMDTGYINLFENEVKYWTNKRRDMRDLIISELTIDNKDMFNHSAGAYYLYNHQKKFIAESDLFYD